MGRRLPASLRRPMADPKPPSGTWRRSSGGTASPGEREAAEWIAEQLRALGADAHTESEQVHGGYWIPVGAPAAAAARLALLALRGGGPARLAALAGGAAAAASVLDDISGGAQVSRRALPKRESRNVVAVAGDPGRRPHARAGRPPRRRARRGRVRPFARRQDRGALAGAHRPVQDLSADHVADGRGPDPHRARRADRLAAPARRRRGIRRRHGGRDGRHRRARPSPRAPATTSRRSPSLLGVAEALRDDPVEGVRVLLVSTGSEESFMEGMRRFMDRWSPELPRDRTTVVCLETLGCPRLALIEGEGMAWMTDYPQATQATSSPTWRTRPGIDARPRPAHPRGDRRPDRAARRLPERAAGLRGPAQHPVALALPLRRRRQRRLRHRRPGRRAQRRARRAA